MKFLFSTLLFLGTFLFLPGTSEAAVFERDWLAPGDGLLTFDDVNHREWLDLTYLLEEYPFRDPSILRDPENRLEAILPELNVGGSLEGFQIASSGDVVALALSAGVDVNVSSAVNEVPVSTLVELLGVTRDGGLGNQSSRGLLDDFMDTSDGPYRLVGGISALPQFNSYGVGFFTLFGSSDDIPSRTISVMLFRQVPEPSTHLILIVCISVINHRIFTSRSQRYNSSVLV